MSDPDMHYFLVAQYDNRQSCALSPFVSISSLIFPMQRKPPFCHQTCTKTSCTHLWMAIKRTSFSKQKMHQHSPEPGGTDKPREVGYDQLSGYDRRHPCRERYQGLPETWRLDLNVIHIFPTGERSFIFLPFFSRRSFSLVVL